MLVGLKRLYAMKIFIIVVVCWWHSFILFAAGDTGQIDSLLKVLDKSILNRGMYTDNKLHVIQELEHQLHASTTDEQKFVLLGRLFDEYKNFRMDSAYAIATKQAALAEAIKEEGFAITATLNQAEVMIVTGMYKEALSILEGQTSEAYNRGMMEHLYHLYHSLYMLMAGYSFVSPEEAYYRELEYGYKDSILSMIDTAHVTYGLVMSSKYLMEKRYNEALALAEKTYLNHTNDRRIAGMITHTIADIYAAGGDTYNGKKYLILSSIYDIQSGVKEYMSLSELSVLLYNEGDIDRAYSYIKCSMEDAIFCKARLRTLEMSQMLPIINATYDIKMKEERDRLFLSLIIIFLLAIVLAVALFFIYKKLKELAMARSMLKQTNGHLNQINADLKKLNGELSESNHIKEEYISYVFTMCSSYIDKLEEFRKQVCRKIKAGQVNDLYQGIKSNTFVHDELKEFYKSFDTIFLNIYPDFVKDFNSLLQDNEHVSPKDNELLSPELRIYALVRLGIGDSVKIAGFLHYSPQTVYNYRLKVRNRAKIPKEEFPNAVKQLGKNGNGF